MYSQSGLAVFMQCQTYQSTLNAVLNDIQMLEWFHGSGSLINLACLHESALEGKHFKYRTLRVNRVADQAFHSVTRLILPVSI